MIQRIQTLWLLLAGISIAFMFYFPLGEMIQLGNEFKFKLLPIDSTSADSVKMATYMIAGLVSLTSLLSILTVFLFKKRLLQMRLCVYNAILMIAILGAEAFLFLWVYGEFDVIPSFAALTPIVSFIFLMMGRRAIKLDELLIKSIDRIR